MRDEKKRNENERKFDTWDELSNGGRRYFYGVQGRHGWSARYIKEVNASERTMKFYQEIYDGEGQLVEIHTPKLRELRDEDNTPKSCPKAN